MGVGACNQAFDPPVSVFEVAFEQSIGGRVLQSCIANTLKALRGLVCNANLRVSAWGQTRGQSQVCPLASACPSSIRASRAGLLRALSKSWGEGASIAPGFGGTQPLPLGVLDGAQHRPVRILEGAEPPHVGDVGGGHQWEELGIPSVNSVPSLWSLSLYGTLMGTPVLQTGNFDRSPTPPCPLIPEGRERHFDRAAMPQIPAVFQRRSVFSST